MLIAWLLFSCEQEPEPLTVNSVITGNVSIDNQNFEEPASVKVVASGPYGQNSALTDEWGRFLIPGLGNGTYYLDYFLEGYGKVRQYGIQLFGNDTARAESVYLYELPPPSFKMPGFLRVDWVYDGGMDPNGILQITTDYKVQHVFWNVRLFFGLTSDVSYRNHDYSYATTSNYNNEIRIDPYYLPFTMSAEVFVIGYSCNQRDNGYLDTYANERIFSTLDTDNHSNVISFTMR